MKDTIKNIMKKDESEQNAVETPKAQNETSSDKKPKHKPLDTPTGCCGSCS